MSEYVYVERDENKNIKGVYANAQPGYAEERLPEDHSSIVAYRASRVPSPRQEKETLSKLTALLIEKGVVTKAEVDAKAAEAAAEVAPK